MSKKDKFSNLLGQRSSSSKNQDENLSKAHNSLLENENVNVNVNVNNAYVRKRSMKFEDRYKRQTFYIENDILDLLNEAAGNEKGEKTRIINDALKRYFGQ